MKKTGAPAVTTAVASPGPDQVVDRSDQEFLEFETRVAEIVTDSGLDIETAYEPTLRHRPTTERGKKTVTHLLDSALDLVAEEGIRATNTRSIARRAGVNIATLYQYFDDVESLLRAAALRDQAIRTAILSQRAIDLATDTELEEWARTTVELTIRGAFATEHHRAVVTTMQAEPALRSIATRGWETGALMLATALSFRYGGDAEGYWLPYARAVQSTLRLIADDALGYSPVDMDRVRQVTDMSVEYLMARIPEPPAGS